MTRRSASASRSIVARGDAAFVILNLYPYNSGHLMVVPTRHVGNLAALTPPELSEIMLLTQRCEIALTEVYQPQGINVGINLGRPAGAGVVDHVHVHLVPRWTGDTNFMSVVGNVRVLPEELGQSAERLATRVFETTRARGRVDSEPPVSLLPMHLELTPAQEAFRAEVEAFARERVAPKAAEIDESNAFPVSLVWEAASRGLLGITIPREHGGLGHDHVATRWRSKPSHARARRSPSS